MNLDRITHPLRLAKGSHQPGSGKGCAMNVISYINGDTKITDYPECSARPLSRLVQLCNDRLAGPDGFLSPEDSITVLDLGWRTVGTADVPDSVVYAWIAELLDSPEWGVIRVMDTAGAAAVRSVADLHRRAAADEVVPAAEWESVMSYAYSHTTTSEAANAAKSATITAIITASEDASEDAADTAVYAAEDTAVYAAETYADAYVEFAAHAIDRWRTLAGLDNQAPIRETDVDDALDRIATSANSPQK